jgi:hypothetical protein
MSSYQIIEASTVRDLTDQVIQQMKAGWAPTTGFAVVICERGTNYLQPMTHYQRFSDIDYPAVPEQSPP